MSEKLTKKQVKAELKALADAAPLNETECQYAVETAQGLLPYCIAGCFFANHGVSVNVLRDLDDGGGLGDNTVKGLYESGHSDLPALTREAVKFLSLVQYYQDRGQNWGAAFKLAVSGE
jgi:hypothetical protein